MRWVGFANGWGRTSTTSWRPSGPTLGSDDGSSGRDLALEEAASTRICGPSFPEPTSSEFAFEPQGAHWPPTRIRCGTSSDFCRGAPEPSAVARSPCSVSRSKQDRTMSGSPVRSRSFEDCSIKGHGSACTILSRYTPSPGNGSGEVGVGPGTLPCAARQRTLCAAPTSRYFRPIGPSTGAGRRPGRVGCVDRSWST